MVIYFESSYERLFSIPITLVNALRSCKLIMPHSTAIGAASSSTSEPDVRVSCNAYSGTCVFEHTVGAHALPSLHAMHNSATK